MPIWPPPTPSSPKTHRALSEKASRDQMTGLLNRESFFAALEGSRRKSDRGALLIIDADHFKKINDGFGHLVGDEALLAIAAAIGRGVRVGDTVARIGGEEFAAFLEGACDRGSGNRRRAYPPRGRGDPLRDARGSSLALTVSIGGTLCPNEATCPICCARPTIASTRPSAGPQPRFSSRPVAGGLRCRRPN